jgi:adenylyltransferase/sulfurtransferase
MPEAVARQISREVGSSRHTVNRTELESRLAGRLVRRRLTFSVAESVSSPRTMEAAMHALRAENAALRAENAALRTDAGAPPSASSRPAPDDSAVSLPPDVRTWESAGAGDALSGADLERYARHISLPAFGAAKQASLARARALIVGVGGLGSPASLYLAAAGVGSLILADADVVERSNLHRQIAHADARAGASKALSAATAIAALNPNTMVKTHLEGVTPQNALALVKDADVVLDCTDNPRARYLLSDACASLSKPLVSAAAVGTEGQLTVYVSDRAETCYESDTDASDTEPIPDLRSKTPPDDATKPLKPSSRLPKRLPCYRCVFPTPPASRDVGNCATRGVLGPVPGVLGTLQALEALKVLSGLGARNGGRLLWFDATADPKRAFGCVALGGRDARCAACGDAPSAGASPRGEAIASYDYDAFLGERAACGARDFEASKRTIENENASASSISADALPAALDDAAAAAARNVARARGDGGAPWATDDPSPAFAGRGARSPSSDRAFKRANTPRRTAVLDAAAKPPVHARMEAEGRLTPSSLVAATRASGDAAVVLDVRPKHLSDAARLRGALAIPLRELDGRVGEVRRAVDRARRAATAAEAAAAARRLRRSDVGSGSPEPEAPPPSEFRVSEFRPDARVFVICSKGNQSQLAAAYLRAAGVPVAGDVLGGYEKWREDVDPSFPKLV